MRFVSHHWIFGLFASLLLLAGCAIETGSGSSGSGGGGSLPAPIIEEPVIIEAPLPDLLPWPPPPASLAVPLRRASILADLGATPNLGAVGDLIEDALSRAGYDGRIRYIGLDPTNGPGVANEFAIVTGLEQIDENAQPLSQPARWAQNIQVESGFSIGGFLNALFFAPRGNYRVLMFVVTERNLGGPPAAPLTAEDVMQISTEGDIVLPTATRDAEFSANHKVYALIYEFQKESNEADPEQIVPGQFRASDHLEDAGLAAYAPG